MDHRRLAQLDLNLLVAFEALFAEGNVTRAARRLGVTQPAMSHALARLRDLLGDPLFTRTPRGVTPTARALALAGPVQRILQDVEEALAPQRFEAATMARTFRVGMADYGQLVLAVPLLRALREQAPRVDLVVRPVPLELEAALEGGELDLALVPAEPSNARLRRQRLFDERFLCVARAGHAAFARRMTPKRFAELLHLQIAVRGTPGGPVDDALARLGLQRRVVLRVPEFLIAPRLVAESDLVLTAPARMIEATRTPKLRAFEPPVPLRPFTFWQAWHERSQRDPAHAWLRGLVAHTAHAL